MTARSALISIIDVLAAKDVITHRDRLMIEGARMFETGKPRPKLRDENDVESDDFFRWLGFALGMWKHMDGRNIVMEMLKVVERDDLDLPEPT